MNSTQPNPNHGWVGFSVGFYLINSTWNFRIDVSKKTGFIQPNANYIWYIFLIFSAILVRNFDQKFWKNLIKKNVLKLIFMIKKNHWFFSFVIMNNSKKNSTQLNSNSNPTWLIYIFSGLGFRSQNPTQPTSFRRLTKLEKKIETKFYYMKSFYYTSLFIIVISNQKNFLKKITENIIKDWYFAKIVKKLKDQIQKTMNRNEKFDVKYQTFRFDSETKLLYFKNKKNSNRLCIFESCHERILHYVHDE